MTNILELCQRIMQRHCQIADAAADLAALVAEQGQEINLLSALVEVPHDEPPPIAEMAVHAPSEPPPTGAVFNPSCACQPSGGVCTGTNDDGRIDCACPCHESPKHAAEFAPDYELQGVELPPAKPTGAKPFAANNLDEPLPYIGGRKKTEMTAREWAYSSHFLNYIKKAPFKDWSATEQVTKRDAFILATPEDLRMNRWGARFSKFCGVA